MQQEDIDIITYLGGLIWSDNTLKKRVFYETYGKTLENKVAEFIECKRRLEMLAKECGMKFQKTRNCCSTMKKLLDKLHIFKIDALSDDEEENTPEMIRCIRMIPNNQFSKNDSQIIDKTDRISTSNYELNYETPISSKFNKKEQMVLNIDKKTEITENSSMEFISAHSENFICTQPSFNECNNNDETVLNYVKSSSIQESINDPPDLYYSAEIYDSKKNENLIDSKNQTIDKSNANIFVSPTELTPSSRLIRPMFCGLPLQYQPLPITFSNDDSNLIEKSFNNDNNISSLVTTGSTQLTSRRTFVVNDSTDQTNKFNKNLTIFTTFKNESSNNVNLINQNCGDVLSDEEKQRTPYKENCKVKFLENEHNSSNTHSSLNERVAQALLSPSDAKIKTFVPFLTCSSSNYDVNDLDSGDETDSAEHPRKPIPGWAKDLDLSLSIKNQRLNLNKKRIQRHFGRFDKPLIDEIFDGFPNRHRYNLGADKTVEWISPEKNFDKDCKKRKNCDKNVN